jgi:predicted GIY-YIG superfamily endonuclease
MIGSTLPAWTATPAGSAFPAWYKDSSLALLYVIECEGGRFYCGSTRNPIARFEAHFGGWGASFTRRFRPLRLASTCVVTDSQARDMEREMTIALGLIFGPSRVNAPEPIIEFSARKAINGTI